FRIDHDHMPIGATAWNEQPLCVDTISLEVPRMTSRRISAPEHDEVRAIAYFSQRASRLTDLLDRHDRRAVANRRRRIDRRTDPIGQENRRPLASRAAPREPPNERRTTRAKNLGRFRDRLRK